MVGSNLFFCLFIWFILRFDSELHVSQLLGLTERTMCLWRDGHDVHILSLL